LRVGRTSDDLSLRVTHPDEEVIEVIAEYLRQYDVNSILSLLTGTFHNEHQCRQVLALHGATAAPH
jgi:hypothetical protein